MIFDQYLDRVNHEQHSRRHLETLWRKGAVCEPGCSHSFYSRYCSRRLSPVTTGGTRSDSAQRDAGDSGSGGVI